MNLQKSSNGEDGTFLKHNGFIAMQKPTKATRGAKNKRRKLYPNKRPSVFLWQGRSYIRKGLEAYFTVLIEIIWGKERIMEVYLNSIEMEMVVYGAQAAAEHWYRKRSWGLTPKQAAVQPFCPS
jgi:monofunctional biosynthetic peptidoglycan transglycosylase